MVSVISGGKIVFCEGKETNLDVNLLNRLVENLSADKVTIVPTGSKFTFSIFAQGYFSRSEGEQHQKYIVFRDRDFDIYPTQDIKLLELISSRGKVLAFLTHRACIENYLLDANLIHSYWFSKYREKQDNPSSKWGNENSPGVEIIEKWIEESAKELQEYQIVRWALADLLQMSAARVQLKTTWTGGSGKLPASLGLQDCKNQANNLIEQFMQATQAVNLEVFKESLIKYQNQFSSTEFWQNKQYLIWFQGKDIQKKMQQLKSQYISLKDFFNWAINQLDINQHPDLVELRSKIEQL